MWRYICRTGIIVTVVMLSGCIVSIGHKGREHEPYRPAEEDAMIMAEIEAAGKLFSDSDKTSVYKDIAHRNGLSGKVQAHLVKESCRQVFSDAGKEEVMVTLIRNPYFDAQGKQAVLRNMNHLFSDARKRRVLKAIDERAKRPLEVAHEVEVRVTAEP